MNLIIDIGNSAAKLALFDGKTQKKSVQIQKKVLVDETQKLLSNNPVSNAIISSVSNQTTELLDKIPKKVAVIELDHNTPKPFTNNYQTPTTLGSDRIALVAAAVGTFPNKNVLIIDAGTCITYDFKNTKEEYFGGAISPGINMRYKAMHHQTAMLPLLQKNTEDDFIGNNTNASMHIGVTEGVIAEIELFISKYNNRFANLTVILTGGDALFLAKRLKNTIFVLKNFLLTGLNHILEYNKLHDL